MRPLRGAQVPPVLACRRLLRNAIALDRIQRLAYHRCDLARLVDRPRWPRPGGVTCPAARAWSARSSSSWRSSSTCFRERPVFLAMPAMQSSRSVLMVSPPAARAALQLVQLPAQGTVLLVMVRRLAPRRRASPPPLQARAIERCSVGLGAALAPICLPISAAWFRPHRSLPVFHLLLCRFPFRNPLCTGRAGGRVYCRKQSPSPLF